MKQEDKELLLKDLCARSPYGVNMKTCHCKLTETLKTYMDINHLIDIGWLPYLRPMSSMTEEELYKFSYLMQQPNVSEIKKWLYSQEMSLITFEDSLIAFDWLNAHLFDYRGLIEKGLALEAPKDMYNIK